MKKSFKLTIDLSPTEVRVAIAEYVNKNFTGDMVVKSNEVEIIMSEKTTGPQVDPTTTLHFDGATVTVTER